MLIAAGVSAALAFLAWRRRPASGTMPFALLMLAVAVWSLGYSIASQHSRCPRECGEFGCGFAALCFWVRDNGPGLTPEEQVCLFTPFTRLDQVRVAGHGLGLSIVRRIVEKLGGQVGVESQVGQGSVFAFTLSAAPDATGEPGLS